MRTLEHCFLYGIVDLFYVDESQIGNAAAAMIDGGVDLIQLRGKGEPIEKLTSLAGRLHDLTERALVPLVINDHPEIARRIPAEGVHLGQDDDSIASARKKVGRKILIGKSTHSPGQAVAAQREGVDYIGFGPIFATPTKPDYQPVGLRDIQRVHNEVSLPIFCIGGIKLDNLEQVLAAGAKRVVMVSGLLKALDVAQYARAAKQLLTSSQSI